MLAIGSDERRSRIRTLCRSRARLRALVRRGLSRQAAGRPVAWQRSVNRRCPESSKGPGHVRGRIVSDRPPPVTPATPRTRLCLLIAEGCLEKENVIGNSGFGEVLIPRCSTDQVICP